MRVAIDVSAAVNGKAGLGRYAAALASAVARQHDAVHLFANQILSGRWPASLAALPHTSIRAGYRPWRMAVWLGQLTGMGWNRLLPPVDVFHATEHLLLPLRHTRTILTVHDLIYKLFPRHHFI